MKITRLRVSIAALALSATGFVGIVSQEGYTGTAVIPTKNDRPTVGLGSTYREDGSPVQIGDTIDPVRAIKRSVSHIAKDEVGLKRCVTGAMTQGEYDVLVDFTYQYGPAKACQSAMVRDVNAGRYAEACNAYAKYKFSGGYDCSIPGNRVCSGVWKRNLQRREKCLEASR